MSGHEPWISAARLDELVRILRKGGVIACPTETLVGLLADALNPRAVTRVAEVKRRRAEDPIAVLLPDEQSHAAIAQDISERALEFAHKHWPGPVTLVVKARPGLPVELTREGKVGVRVPGSSAALELVRAFGGPLTATSANISGSPAARTTSEARAVFGDQLDAYVDGESPGSPPSSVIDVTTDPWNVIRGELPR